MANFTKGPWKAERNQSFSYSIHTDYVHDRGHDCNVIREVRCEANAFLVAAAPEMFAALEAARDWMATQAPASDYANNIRKQLAAALAKAVSRG